MTENKELYYMDGLSAPEIPEAGKPLPPWKETRVVGKPKTRVDAYERVSGSAVYPSDVILPGMLYGAILRCPHPNATVKKVDVSKARKMPGVEAVVCGADPEANLIWQYSKDYKDKIFPKNCRFEGEAVAAVAAATPYQAQDALKTIRVEYDVLDFVCDERNALEPDSPKVHEDGNEIKTDQYERGNVDEGFRQADAVLEQSYRTACQIHTPMELHGCVADWKRDRLTVWESTQGVYRVQQQVAEVLGLPMSKVRVVGNYMGGGFGSKLKAGKYTVVAAILARMAGRPVKMFVTREDSFLAMGNRPPGNMKIKAGVKKDGVLTALEFTATGTGGAYPAGGTSLLDFQVKELYKCENVRTEVTDIFINAGPARPFRAPGHPQCSWALEQMMDSLAAEIGMDPVELRLKNLVYYSQSGEGNPEYTSSGLKECLEQGAKEFRWAESLEKAKGASEKGHIKRGVGMAACMWFVGGGRPPSTVILKLFSDGSVNLNMGASDIGTGTKSVMAMVVAEELGVKEESIQIEHADTGTTQYASPSGGSKTVPTESPAVRDACVKVKRQLLDMAAGDLQTDAKDLTFAGSKIVSRTDPAKAIAITDISGLKSQAVVVGVGIRGPNPANKKIHPFGAQFCEVEVDTMTGEVKILRFLGAHDSGRVMNRLTYDNQVFGGIAMGIGFGMTEERVLDRNTGKLANRSWHDYKLPTSLDVPPDQVSSPVDMPDDEANTTGAKGLGEPVTIPTAAAVANAIFNATGVRVPETPMSQVQLCRLFDRAGKEA